MKNAKEIISSLGGTMKAAAALGVSPQAVSNWIRRGTVPLSHAADIIVVARDLGVEITYQDLME
tara:strand:- start:389 stop:580 length:192 start_codon:yes stop_codon:yes gene_type:complete